MAKYTYRTKDGEAYFGFSVERQPDNSLRAYIIRCPAYQSRSTDSYMTHRTYDVASTRYYLDWGKPLYSKDEILPVMQMWAECTQRYICTGIPFERQKLNQ